MYMQIPLLGILMSCWSSNLLCFLVLHGKILLKSAWGCKRSYSWVVHFLRESQVSWSVFWVEFLSSHSVLHTEFLAFQTWFLHRWILCIFFAAEFYFVLPISTSVSCHWTFGMILSYLSSSVDRFLCWLVVHCEIQFGDQMKRFSRGIWSSTHNERDLGKRGELQGQRNRGQSLGILKLVCILYVFEDNFCAFLFMMHSSTFCHICESENPARRRIN